MLQCLKEISDVLSHAKASDINVCAILCGNGVLQQAAQVWDTAEASYNEWSKDFIQKVQQQGEQHAKAFHSLSKTMPVYRADNHEASMKEIAKYQNSSMEKLVGVISTMKSFSAAVKVCSALAGLSVDNTILMDAIVSGSTFIYVYTIIMISMSPLWQSMTPDMASKEGSKHKDIAKNMQYTLNQVSNEKIILPEAIQSLASEKLAKAGLKLA